jgi:hypothetical protein
MSPVEFNIHDMVHSKIIDAPGDEIDEKIDNYHKWKESFWGKLEEKWWDFLGWRINEFKLGCKSVIKWFPTIWKDRDYSSFNILEILKKKLYFTAKLHIQNQRYVGWERNVELMTLCIKLIDFIQNEHYEDVAYEYIESKYGESKFQFIPIENSTSSELKIEHEKIESGQYTEEEYREEYRKVMDEAHDKHRRARTLLFKILDRHVESWWD